MIVVLLEIYSDIYLISRFEVSSSYHQLPHFISTAQQNIAQEESLFGLQTDTLTHQGFKQEGGGGGGLGLGCPLPRILKLSVQCIHIKLVNHRSERARR